MTIPPGDKSVIFVKWTSFIINNDYMNEIPVSEAPTTTIRVLFSILVTLRCFLVIMEREKGASYSSKGFLVKSIPPLFVKLRS